MVTVAAASSVILILVTTVTIASIVLSSAPLKCVSICGEGSTTPMELPSRKQTTSCVTLIMLY